MLFGCDPPPVFWTEMFLRWNERKSIRKRLLYSLEAWHSLSPKTLDCTP